MKKLSLIFGLIICVLFASVDVKAQSRPISSQAKGAIIGAAGGALLGGIIGHNVKGALIGAAIGAGGGYIVGNEHNRNVQKRYAAYNHGYQTGYRNGSHYTSRRTYQTSYRAPSRSSYSSRYACNR